MSSTLLTSVLTRSPTATTTATSSSDTTSATPSCVTVTPGKYGYVPNYACNAQWDYNPSFAAAVLFSCLFGAVTVAHIFLATKFKKRYCWVVIMGCIWETVSFILRALGAHNQQDSNEPTYATLLILLAPLWVNAFVYMVLGRMIYFFLPERRIIGIKAASVAKYFVWLDVASFSVQVAGGIMISMNGSPSITLDGTHVYMGGVGMQECFILCFMALAITFHRRMLVLESRGETAGRKGWKKLLFTLYAVLTLITIRIIYRLVEWSAGQTQSSNPIPYHEAYVYCLDALPVLGSVAALCIVHPGFVLIGPESDFPKLTRAEKKERKRVQKGLKQAEKEEKRDEQKNKSRTKDAVLTVEAV